MAVTALFSPIFHKWKNYSLPHSSHARACASLGMRQSPRGDRLIEPTLGPSGKHERLNWLAKKRSTKTLSQRRSSSDVYGLSNWACRAKNRIFSGGAP